MKKHLNVALFTASLLILFSCARQGTPSGGPKDVTPPVFVSSFPDTLAVNVDPNIKEIKINFDEYIQLKDYNKNAVISPPFEKNPVVSPITMAEKYVTIKLQESLQPNTTYSFNFGDAIQDYNENNKLKNFNYVFSTGSFIDSLSVKGKVYPVKDFKLPEKVLVGLYKYDENYNDSIPLKSKPYYISRVNELGEYELKFLKEGSYKIIAFEDEIENTKFDPAKEKVGFTDKIIDLNTSQNVDLKLFSPKKTYRITNLVQKGEGHLVLRTVGVEEPLKISLKDKTFNTLLVDQHLDKDSVNIWFNPKVDKIQGKSERLAFEIKHKDKIDNQTVLYSASSQEYEAAYTANKETKFQPNKDFNISGLIPIKSVKKELINVFRDTIPINFDVEIDPVNKQQLNFKFEKNLKEKFEINIYPKAIKDIFDVENDTLVYQFNTGTREDFGNLKFKINNLDPNPIIVQLLKNSKDFEVVEEVYSSDREFYFPNILPGEYYLRILVDANKNGVWDSGDFINQLQPESSYIYPTKLIIRPLWDSDETWIIGKESENFILLPEIKEEEKDKNKQNQNVNQQTDR